MWEGEKYEKYKILKDSLRIKINETIIYIILDLRIKRSLLFSPTQSLSQKTRRDFACIKAFFGERQFHETSFKQTKFCSFIFLPLLSVRIEEIIILAGCLMH